jgi:phage terminase small subunit
MIFLYTSYSGLKTMPNRKTPNHLKLAKGNYRPGRHGAMSEPREATYPDTPTYFDGELVEIWKQTKAYLEPLEYVDLTDIFALEIYCKLLHESRTNPDMTATKLTLLRLTAADLGMTPASREKMPKPIKKTENNPFADM